ncbi:MAG: carbohydrate ABC transporter permease [Desulfobacterales bacterium]|nr:MAG: carbohydrate ABC transporter permease [Desulfobacterales bacterium]
MKGYRKVLWWTAVVLVLSFFTLPILWLIYSSFKSAADIYYAWKNFAMTLDNYVEIWEWLGNLDDAMINSAIVATLSTIFSLLVVMLSGYFLARFKETRSSKAFFFLIYVVRTIPIISWVIPLYLILQQWGLTDTITGLLFAHIAFHVCFFTIVLSGFYENIPRQLDEAARIDGCSRWGVFWRIAVPLIIPGLAASAILNWIWTWNEFLFALILTGYDTPMLTPSIVQFVHEMGMEWHLMAAASTVAIIPPIIVTFIAQRYIIMGYAAFAHEKA